MLILYQVFLVCNQEIKPPKEIRKSRKFSLKRDCVSNHSDWEYRDILGHKFFFFHFFSCRLYVTSNRKTYTLMFGTDKKRKYS